MNLIEIEIVKWKEYQVRKDTKSNSWFRMEHDFFDSEQFWEFSREELCFFFYLLCLASKNNSGTIQLSIDRAVVVGRFKKKAIVSSIEKLKVLKIIKLQDKVKMRDEHVTYPLRESANTNSLVTLQTDRQTLQTDITWEPAKNSGSPESFFIGKYVEAFQKKYPGGRPELGGKVQGQIKTFLKDRTLQRACELIEVYFQIEDPWFQKKFYDFTTFTENLTKVSVALDSGEDQTNGCNLEKILEKERLREARLLNADA